MSMPAVLTMKVLMTVSALMGFLAMEFQTVQVSVKQHVIWLFSFLPFTTFFHFPLSDIDECLNVSCHVNADCLDTPGSYICRCKTGFKGNGTFCESKQLHICESRTTFLSFILPLFFLYSVDVYYMPFFSISLPFKCLTNPCHVTFFFIS